MEGIMIGENIKKLREKKGYGVNQLAKLAGVNSSYLSALERGEKKNPSTKIINKLASALGIPMDLILKDNTKRVEDITNELHKISDFSALDMTEDEQKEAVKEILSQDPSIFYELSKELQSKYVVQEQQSDYSNFPAEAQKEINDFMNYIKHKYNIKGV